VGDHQDRRCRLQIVLQRRTWAALDLLHADNKGRSLEACPGVNDTGREIHLYAGAVPMLLSALKVLRGGHALEAEIERPCSSR